MVPSEYAVLQVDFHAPHLEGEIEIGRGFDVGVAQWPMQLIAAQECLGAYFCIGDFRVDLCPSRKVTCPPARSARIEVIENDLSSVGHVEIVERKVPVASTPVETTLHVRRNRGANVFNEIEKMLS